MAFSVPKGIRVAVEGCGHGTLNAIYTSVKKACKVKGWDGVDLLIIGGDFQAVRNAQDLNCMAVPLKYREIGDFHEYYSGARVAPYLTIFVGGNHEASNHLWELYYGGWVAPNIFYMGAANVLRLGPLRIAGLSGIWKGYNYKKPHYERLPYNNDDVRSIYHVRESDTRKLLQIRTPVDIGISHDWPRGVEWMGDWKTLFRKKSHFEEDAKTGSLGSVAAKLVLDRLRPAYWFSAHLHVKYAAIVNHTKTHIPDGTRSVKYNSLDSSTKWDGSTKLVNEEEIDIGGSNLDTELHEVTKPVQNADEIDLEMSDKDDEDHKNTGLLENRDHNNSEIGSLFQSGDLPKMPVLAYSMTLANPGYQKPDSSDVDPNIRAQLPASFNKSMPKSVQPDPPTLITNDRTQFLALDKCLPNRHFLQLMEIIPITNDNPATSRSTSRPFKFTYDPEWLAITRVFAKDLQLGDPSDRITPDLGHAHYLPLIEQEEKWVEENITRPGKLHVPENFTLTAPTHDATKKVSMRDMPREYSNPQTASFCALLDIPNPFSASEEEMAERQKAGPRSQSERGGSSGGRGAKVGSHAFGRGRGGRNAGRWRGGRR